MLDDTNLKEFLHCKHVGKGLLEQIEEINEPFSQAITVEYLYENFPSEYWSILDDLLKHRPDLQDRIKKYKEEHKRG